MRMGRDNITRLGARAPGVERRMPLAWRVLVRATPPAQNGDCAFASGEHEGWMQTRRRDTRTPRGKALLDMPALKPYWGKPAVRKCVQRRLARSVGDKPTEATVSSLVAWILGRKETELPKRIDKAIFGMVSESSGRNESERIGELERRKLQRPSPLP